MIAFKQSGEDELAIDQLMLSMTASRAYPAARIAKETAEQKLKILSHITCHETIPFYKRSV
jgi:hypothetical protein